MEHSLKEESGKLKEDFASLTCHAKFLVMVKGFVVNPFTHRFHVEVYFEATILLPVTYTGKHWFVMDRTQIIRLFCKV